MLKLVMVKGKTDHGIRVILALHMLHNGARASGTALGHREEAFRLLGHSQLRVEVPHNTSAVYQRDVRAAPNVGPVVETCVPIRINIPSI